ncbi:hypothetical protein PHYBLDRAFT_67097 [Phycomyces blakesleeanus NRRL 1555(-)]|uniref:Uncharacterized protein n=1 Tax=Phycomyces blakesleeanus (strain ATCC 8743b / DSM 1359 / FGSC 10004 / NBRC 33097 / NRRL 1555) TaxID=763407 RepID=A0A162ZTW0_PHYB8|nr:hypothetical protein PHYBLDRAFT_67097 [Phycomyces blakesleeanus NRRL 1555(-)]OAD69001.1 hypothetical protein PHYBLDRAFT_67097 [Phycomyces blakesleeanus NRRL 1555(-)]|eukprot:XP_018287041.1 hypothetical protein PHYBLDRAFT_67097 [Phycomyces blakesleeanus NRRL 1555(-)]
MKKVFGRNTKEKKSLALAKLLQEQEEKLKEDQIERKRLQELEDAAIAQALQEEWEQESQIPTTHSPVVNSPPHNRSPQLGTRTSSATIQTLQSERNRPSPSNAHSSPPIERSRNLNHTQPPPPLPSKPVAYNSADNNNGFYPVYMAMPEPSPMASTTSLNQSSPMNFGYLDPSNNNANNISNKSLPGQNSFRLSGYHHNHRHSHTNPVNHPIEPRERAQSQGATYPPPHHRLSHSFVVTPSTAPAAATSHNQFPFGYPPPQAAVPVQNYGYPPPINATQNLCTPDITGYPFTNATQNHSTSDISNSSTNITQNQSTFDMINSSTSTTQNPAPTPTPTLAPAPVPTSKTPSHRRRDQSIRISTQNHIYSQSHNASSMFEIDGFTSPILPMEMPTPQAKKQNAYVNTINNAYPPQDSFPPPPSHRHNHRHQTPSSQTIRPVSTVGDLPTPPAEIIFSKPHEHIETINKAGPSDSVLSLIEDLQGHELLGNHSPVQKSGSVTVIEPKLLSRPSVKPFSGEDSENPFADSFAAEEPFEEESYESLSKPVSTGTSEPLSDNAQPVTRRYSQTKTILPAQLKQRQSTCATVVEPNFLSMAARSTTPVRRSENISSLEFTPTSWATKVPVSGSGSGSGLGPVSVPASGAILPPLKQKASGALVVEPRIFNVETQSPREHIPAIVYPTMNVRAGPPSHESYPTQNRQTITREVTLDDYYIKNIPFRSSVANKSLPSVPDGLLNPKY